MQILKIFGGARLEGTIDISGAKNAVLPIMCASLLTEEPVVLTNVPFCSDVYTLANLLKDLGALVQLDEEKKMIVLEAKNITKTTASYDFVSKMRASFWVLGPLMGRFAKACVAFPGGCAIGARPVDFYQMALKEMGAEITVENGYVKAEGKLKGASITFPKKSVGATHNTIMAAVLTPGTTTIHNPALEPEVGDLIHVLQKMGADIQGEGTPTLTIKGVSKLHGTTHAIIPDRIETASYILAVALTKGRALLRGGELKYTDAFNQMMEVCHVKLTQKEDGILVDAKDFTPVAMPVSTCEYPGFPTDMQSIMCTLLCIAPGSSLVTENIFENRFMHVSELQRMGANITQLDARSILINGVEELTGAQVQASDLRNGFALVLAGLIAKGETVVSHINFIDRGYTNIEGKLSALGAHITRLDVFQSGEVNQE